MIIGCTPIVPFLGRIPPVSKSAEFLIIFSLNGILLIWTFAVFLNVTQPRNSLTEVN